MAASRPPPRCHSFRPAIGESPRRYPLPRPGALHLHPQPARRFRPHLPPAAAASEHASRLRALSTSLRGRKIPYIEPIRSLPDEFPRKFVRFLPLQHLPVEGRANQTVRRPSPERKSHEPILGFHPPPDDYDPSIEDEAIRHAIDVLNEEMITAGSGVRRRTPPAARHLDSAPARRRGYVTPGPCFQTDDSRRLLGPGRRRPRSSPGMGPQSRHRLPCPIEVRPSG